MSAQCCNQLGQRSIACNLAEVALDFQHPSRSPAQNHNAVSPENSVRSDGRFSAKSVDFAEFPGRTERIKKFPDSLAERNGFEPAYRLRNLAAASVSDTVDLVEDRSFLASAMLDYRPAPLAGEHTAEI